jgi:nucleoside-diphosphate-sugar epimerase
MDDDLVYVNYQKIRRATGWSPAVKSMDAIREILAWAQEHRDELAKIYEGV